MPSRNVKPDLDRLGIFKEMTYHTINDPYNPGQSVIGNVDAHKGRQLQCGNTKIKSALSDGYFSTFRRVFVGDNVIDMGSVVRKQRISSKKLNKGKDWIPPSCPKILDASGSNYGTFSGPVPYLKPTSIKIQTKPSHYKSIVTSPGKKGSGSYVDICLNQYPKHSADPYDRIEQLRAKEAHLQRSLTAQKRPFCSKVHPVTYFDPNPYRGHKMPRRAHSSQSGKGLQITTPFRPSGTSKTDGGCKDGCFDKFPTYMSGTTRKSKQTLKSAPVFHPSYGPLPYPILSIVDLNVKRSVNSANYKQIRGAVYV